MTAHVIIIIPIVIHYKHTVDNNKFYLAVQSHVITAQDNMDLN